MKLVVRRGDIVDVDLDGAVGYEKMNDALAGSRPCVVVQNDKGNEFSELTIVVPLTDVRQAKLLPVQVQVSANDLLMPGAKASVIECGHVRTVDGNQRIKALRGKVGPDVMDRVDRALRVSLGLNKSRKPQ